MPALLARKQPSQARSRATVSAILEATARILTERSGSFTTTRVAERAGVGIGTLYQYYPSKEALLAALHEREMEAMEASISRALATMQGAPLAAQLTAAIDGVLAHKRKRPELSMAIRAELTRVEGQPRLRKTIGRIEVLMRELLEAHAAELPQVDLRLAAQVITSAVEGALTAAIDRAPSEVRAASFREALIRLVMGYLKESGWNK